MKEHGITDRAIQLSGQLASVNMGLLHYTQLFLLFIMGFSGLLEVAVSCKAILTLINECRAKLSLHPLVPQ